VEVAALQQKLDRLATELEQSQNELFHTAEEAVATELALKSELDGIRVSREQAESKLAATVSEHEATVAQA
jgi:predicted transcriptional regulator